MHFASINLMAVWVHPAMLGWLAAAAAPLLIHLLSRRRYREVQWAAMQYLIAAARKNSRRIRVENWLLLLLRTAAIVAVVLALGEPMLQRTGMASRVGEPTHKVIVLDASYSMAFRPTDRTHFQRAKQLAEQIVNESTQGDGFSLVLMAAPPQVVVASPSFTAAEFLQEIAAAKVTHGGGDLASTLADVEQILDTTRREYPRLAQQQVFILTDLGRTSWAPDLSAEALTEFRERSRRLGETASLTLIDLGQPAAESSAIEQLRILEPITTVGQDATLAGELRNFGRQTVVGQSVELVVDGQHRAETSIDLAAGGRTTISFPLRFDTPGEHAVELRLAPDQLDVDNHRYLALPVKDRLRVLCVDGRPMGGAFKSATDYLTVALAPPVGQQYRAHVRPDVIAESALLDTDLTLYDAVFLCDVAQFTDREAKVLRSYLDYGGGLIFFLGEQVRGENYDRQLFDVPADRRVLPARLGRIVDEARFGLDPLGYRHPLVSVFRDAEQAGLLTTPVQKYFALSVPEGSAAQTAVAFDNGDPFIVDEAIGRGRSIVVATTADTTWTSLPMWPSYLPIVQELLSLAVRGQYQEHNVTVGEPLGALLPSTTVEGVDVRLPSGETKPASLEQNGAERSWLFTETTTSGIYRALPKAPRADAAPELSFAVNVDTVESNLEQIDAAELKNEIWSGVRFYHRTNWRDADAELGTEIVIHSKLHVWLLTLAFGLLLGESVLNWFSGRNAR